MKIILVITFLLILIPLQACAHSPFYSAKEIKATIVDAETGEPLEGVVVVAQWILFEGGIGHGGHGRRLEVLEAVTDKEGKFTITGWGPKRRPAFTYLDNLDPLLSIFKSGYKYTRLINAPFEEFSRMYPNYKEMDTEKLLDFILTHNLESKDAIRTSIWNGTVIRLRKFKGTEEDWLDELQKVLSDSGRRENLKKVRKLLESLNNEKTHFHPGNIKAKIFFEHIERLLREAR